VAFWFLTPGQRQQLDRVVRGREIVDLGAGDGSLVRLCLELGAERVLALDKEYGRDLSIEEPWQHECLVQDVQLLPNQVALISWPVTSFYTTNGLLQAVERCGTVVYIGFNDNVTACGNIAFFNALELRYGTPFQMDRRQHMRIYGEVPVGRETKADQVGP
jgi:hypothetical protein